MTTSTIENTVILDVTPVREQVAVEINTLLDDIGNSYMKVGVLLTEARDDFENQKEFLEWADASFGIKKSQAYNLMNVSRNFAQRKEFHGIAMRILVMLLPFADDGELMDKAADLANVGELDVAACNQLLGKPTKGAVSPALQAVKQALAAQASTQQADWQAREVTLQPQATAQHSSSEEAPWDEPETITPAATLAPEATTPAPAMPAAISEGILEELKRLREDNQALNARILELTAAREVRKSSAPMLPQFKSKCLYARLGLSVEQSMSLAAVNKAKRELVKLGYGEGHEAWALIQEAVTSLGK